MPRSADQPGSRARSLRIGHRIVVAQVKGALLEPRGVSIVAHRPPRGVSLMNVARQLDVGLEALAEFGQNDNGAHHQLQDLH